MVNGLGLRALRPSSMADQKHETLNLDAPELDP